MTGRLEGYGWREMMEWVKGRHWVGECFVERRLLLCELVVGRRKAMRRFVALSVGG